MEIGDMLYTQYSTLPHGSALGNIPTLSAICTDISQGIVEFVYFITYIGFHNCANLLEH